MLRPILPIHCLKELVVINFTVHEKCLLNIKRRYFTFGSHLLSIRLVRSCSSLEVVANEMVVKMMKKVVESKKRGICAPENFKIIVVRVLKVVRMFKIMSEIS